MSITRFQDELASDLGKALKLKINDNRSTMLSVRWEPDCTKVSMHRMFLQAPRNVMQALVCYIKQEHGQIDSAVRAFIEDGVKHLDYSHLVDREKMEHKGNIYNLRAIYETLNQEYFQGKLDLQITWYGDTNQRNRSRCTFGLYQDPLKLIKINRILDNPTFPDYLISFVVYHEMVHHVCPAYMDKKGFNRVHNKEFKEKEKQFRYYDSAQKWIKNNHENLFSTR